MNTNGASEAGQTYDLCVIGGGINGVGIARDAAGRGLSVLLVEKDDLGHGTSSRSGKLVHGGLRYLEYYEFRLVREALIEREVLLESAPHIIWPMRFVLPHSAEDRPAWLIRTGLFLYDHLGGRKRLPGTRKLNLRKAPEGQAVQAKFKKAFEYSDCWVDDARLVMLNALDAADKGAVIKSRTVFHKARRTGTDWQVDIEDLRSGGKSVVTARCLVNAAGPWVNQVIDSVDSVRSKRRVRLVKGSHIVVKKFWQGDQAYLIQNTDKRVIFVNPYENGKALIGTTDIPYEGDPGLVCIDDVEIDYLLAALNRYFNHTLNHDDIIQSFSGVRPLYDDSSDNPSAVTRDYLFDLDLQEDQAPLLSVFGGKITTFRKLAEHALEKLSGCFPNMGSAWTSGSALPGGDIADANFDRFFSELAEEYSGLDRDLVRHYARLYGTYARRVLDGVKSTQDLGLQFSDHLFEKEVRYLINNEWAFTVEDILTRRTKHSLHMTDAQITKFDKWFNDNCNSQAEVKEAS